MYFLRKLKLIIISFIVKFISQQRHRIDELLLANSCTGLESLDIIGSASLKNSKGIIFTKNTYSKCDVFSLDTTWFVYHSNETFLLKTDERASRM